MFGLKIDYESNSQYKVKNKICDLFSSVLHNSCSEESEV